MMSWKSPLQYKNQSLHFGDFSLLELKNGYTGPIYLGLKSLFESRYKTLSEGLASTRIFYAMKANPHTEILKLFKQRKSGVDVVSGGEIERALESGFSPGDLIYSGVGKTRSEISQALLLGIHQINIESVGELRRVLDLSRALGKKPNVVLRYNPDVEVSTHKFVKTGGLDHKFGMDQGEVNACVEILRSSKEALLRGLSVHLGSQLFSVQELEFGFQKQRDLFLGLRREFSSLDRLDFGGGLGIEYESLDWSREKETLDSYKDLVRRMFGTPEFADVELQSEPGRWLVGHGVVLVCELQYIKSNSKKNFLVMDTGMNHLLRPSLYEAYHLILPVVQREGRSILADVVGPICETADCLATIRDFIDPQEGDLFVIADVGAYGASMSSDYNLQKRAREVFI